MYMLNEKYTKNEKIEQDAIRVLIPNINEEIPLFVVFRALGIVSDKSIVDLIIDNIDSNLGKTMLDILRPSINEGNLINSEVLALNYLKSKTTALKSFRR